MKSENIINLTKNERYICTNEIKSVKCLDGEFWITYKNGRDIILTKEEDLNLKNKKKVIIQVLKNGRIHLKKKNFKFYNHFKLLKNFLYKPSKTIKSY